jgi:hypothetical protein
MLNLLLRHSNVLRNSNLLKLGFCNGHVQSLRYSDILQLRCGELLNFCKLLNLGGCDMLDFGLNKLLDFSHSKMHRFCDRWRWG